jgi:hypothetical protein
LPLTQVYKTMYPDDPVEQVRAKSDHRNRLEAAIKAAEGITGYKWFCAQLDGRQWRLHGITTKIVQQAVVDREPGPGPEPEPEPEPDREPEPEPVSAPSP